jgi:hypothetical protein
MRSVLGFALAVLFALPVTAMAEEARGKIKAIDLVDHAFVLEDGTRLWIDEGRLADLREGEKVLATYSTRDGKRIVSELEFRTAGEAGETTNLGNGITAPFDEKSIQGSE